MPELKRVSKKIFIFTLSFIIFILLYVLSSDAATKGAAWAEKKKFPVLFLNTFNIGDKWGDDVTKGILEIFDGETDYIDFHIEYMNAGKGISEKNTDQLLKAYKIKYKNISPRIVICSDNDAFNFIKDYGYSVFPDAFTVFCGTDYVQELDISDCGGFFGVNKTADFRSAIKLIFKVHPGTKHIYIINDKSPLGLMDHQQIKTASSYFQERADFTFLENFRMDHLLKRIKHVPEDSIVIFTQFSGDKTGRYADSDRNLEMITESSPVPVYGTRDYNLGKGIIGGRLTSGYSQGVEAANIAIKIINGESFENIKKINLSPVDLIFDYKVLKKFNVKHKKLPRSSIIVNKPEKKRQSSRYLAKSGVFVILLFTIVACTFTAALYLKNKGAIHFPNSETRPDPPINNIPAIVYRYSGSYDRRLLYIGGDIEKICGYDASDFNKKSEKKYSDIIVDEDADYVEKAIQIGISNKQVYSLEYRIICRDNTEKWVYEKGNGIYSNGGELLYLDGVIIDISQRKILEEEIQKSEESLEEIFTSSPVGLGMVINNELTRVNNKLCELLAYSAEELEGKSEKILYPTEEDFSYTKDERLKSMPENIRTRFITKDSRIIEVVLSFAAIENEKISKGFTFTALDVSEANSPEE